MSDDERLPLIRAALSRAPGGELSTESLAKALRVELRAAACILGFRSMFDLRTHRAAVLNVRVDEEGNQLWSLKQ